MTTRNVFLTEHQAELVERPVATGRFQNASEVLREGLRLVETRDAEDSVRLGALRDAARVGIADADAGRVRSFDSPAALREHLRELASRSIPGTPRRKRRFA